MTITVNLSAIIAQHQLWLCGKGGSRANLSRADLSSAVLSGADLRDADLSRADLSGADLSRADLRDSDLSRADLRDAVLKDADLSRVVLRDAVLRDADLSGAVLRDADLSRVVLSGADGIVSFGPVGNKRRIGYAVRHGVAMVQLGCFWGTEKAALVAVKAKYGSRSTYAALVVAACREVMK
jgi:uncharacterized protein YjbI with pentapeptide repeats